MHAFLTAPFAVVAQKFVKPIELSTSVLVDIIEQLELLVLSNIEIESVLDIELSTAHYVALTELGEEVVPVLEIPSISYVEVYALHADTEAYYNRVVAAGGSVTMTELTALDREIVRPILAQSIALNEFAPLMGNGLAAAAQKVWNATPLTFMNFTAADYSRTGGITGDGSTKYAKTGFIPSGTLSETSATIGVWNNTATNSLTQMEVYAQSSAASAFGLMCRFSDNRIYFDCSNQTASAGRLSTSIANQGTGMIIGTRSTANNIRIHRNANTTASGTGSGGTLPNQELYVWAANNAGTPINFSTKNLLLYFVGPGVTATQADLLATYCRNFLTAIGRQ